MTPDTDLPDVVGAEYVAEQWGIHLYTAHRYLRRGEVPGQLPKVGRRYRINRAEFDAARAMPPQDGAA